MPEEINTTNGGGGTSEQSPEQIPEAKQGRSGKIVAIVAMVLIIAGAIYAWARRAPGIQEANEPAIEQGAEQGAQTGQPAPGEGNVPEAEVSTSTGEAAGTTGQADATATAGETAAPAETPAESATIITHTDSGYSPQTVTVKKGATVTFKNESDSQTWPASAVHPTHTAYPGSGINKCGTSEESTIFDACRGLNKGEQWSFKFDNAGSWKYHDHLNPSHFGTIVVE